MFVNRVRSTRNNLQSQDYITIPQEFQKHAQLNFELRSEITHIDATNWDIRNVTNLSYIFFGCTNLRTITGLETWNTSHVTTMKGMFGYCASLTRLDGIKNWNTSNVTDISVMFNGCKSLCKSEDGSICTFALQWNTLNVKNMCGTFNGCESLEHLSLSTWRINNVEKMTSFINSCKSLRELSIHHFVLPDNVKLSIREDVDNTHPLYTNSNRVVEVICDDAGICNYFEH